MGVLLHWTQANSFELVVCQSHGRPQGRQNRGESWRGDWSDGSIAPRKSIVLSQKCCEVYFILK